MKSKLLINAALTTVFLLGTTITQVLGQRPGGGKDFYSTTGGEVIFSWADVTKADEPASSIVRFAPVFNFQYQLNKDFSNHIGLLTGVNIRNIGFIFDDPTTINTRYKARAYTIGVPIGLKLGNMDGSCLFGGYEIELPFNYKEKKFVNEVKTEKNTSWFSDKTPTIYQSFFVGFKSVFGAQLKFKYYMTSFFNKDYSADNGSGVMVYPYKNINANVMYISLSFQVLKGTRYAYKD
jgi:hypothetical protein